MTANDDTLTTLFRHHLWANELIFQACAGLSEAQLGSKIDGVYGSIGDTLEHITMGEQSYLHRIRTGQPYARLPNPPPMKMDEMIASIRETGEGLIAAAPGVLATDTVAVKWDDGSNQRVPLTILLTQAINHATEHRAQIVTMLTQLGLEAPSLDGWTYFEMKIA